MTGPPTTLGCPQCWPADPEAAWKARAGLTGVAELVDDLHFIVTILACPACRQRFLSVLEEEVDWVDGDDPQYWSLLPLTADEAASLLPPAAAPTSAQLNALGPGRRSLRRDCPKGDAQRFYWGTGLSLR
ncbi:MAG: hypothetical protein SF070_16470 [Gemmatimonadota bacterium]|nr:hypothetical protein [Gemmatimonadota bacterium]